MGTMIANRHIGSLWDRWRSFRSLGLLWLMGDGLETLGSLRIVKSHFRPLGTNKGYRSPIRLHQGPFRVIEVNWRLLWLTWADWGLISFI